MVVATNDATAAAIAAMAALGLAEFLPYVFGYDSVPHPKPAPDIVFAFAAAVGVRPHDVAVVGDNRYDMEMARAAGAELRSACSPATAAPRSCTFADVVLPTSGNCRTGWPPRKETAIARSTTA